jgi:Xaa-Pro aminopeptidase
MFDTNTYRTRRAALCADMRKRGIQDGLVLILGNRESPMNYTDNAYTFRQDSSFLYFAGIPQPALALALDIASGKAVLFGDEITMADEVWTGHRPSVKELGLAAGISETRPRSDVAAFASRSPRVLFLPPYRAEHRLELAEVLGLPVRDVDAKASLDLVRAVVALREIKEPREIKEIDGAVDVSIAMHRAVVAMAKPGLRESDLAARATEVALAGGAGLSFPIIGTIRGEVLHNHEHDGILSAGDLFLMDAGAESREGYAGDLSTTFPVGGRFDEMQRVIYDIVMKAHKAAFSILAPGVPFRKAHFAAAKTIVEGLKELGLMKGDADAAVAAGAHALFFPCGVGHQMGLDVHDMESLGEVWVGYDGIPKSEQFGLSSLRMSKPLKPGMVVTVEPGIYFIPPLIEQWKAEGHNAEFVNFDKIKPYIRVGGLRNEEDWLITENGARKLGGPFDKSADALEAAVGKGV